MTQSKFDLNQLAKINFKKISQIVRQENENSALYPPVYPKAEELKQLNELLVQIIQFSIQKAYIQQKRFHFGHETTQIIREKKKKRRELKITNKQKRTIQINEKGNKLSPKRKKEVQKTIGKNQTTKIDRKCSK